MVECWIFDGVCYPGVLMARALRFVLQTSMIVFGVRVKKDYHTTMWKNLKMKNGGSTKDSSTHKTEIFVIVFCRITNITLQTEAKLFDLHYCRLTVVSNIQ